MVSRVVQDACKVGGEHRLQEEEEARESGRPRGALRGAGGRGGGVLGETNGDVLRRHQEGLPQHSEGPTVGRPDDGGRAEQGGQHLRAPAQRHLVCRSAQARRQRAIRAWATAARGVPELVRSLQSLEELLPSSLEDWFGGHRARLLDSAPLPGGQVEAGRRPEGAEAAEGLGLHGRHHDPGRRAA